MTVSIKKLAWFIFFIVFFIGTILGIYFGVQYKNQKEINSRLYTEEQVEEKYRTYVEQVKNKNLTIEELNNRLTVYVEQLSDAKAEKDDLQSKLDEKAAKISELNETITNLEQQVSEINAQITSLQNEITRLNGLLESYEDLRTGTYEVSFFIGEELYKTKAVRKGTMISESVEPETNNRYRFEGWSLDGANVVDYKTISINEDTSFHAVTTAKFKVQFINNDEEYVTQYVVKGDKAIKISNPEKDLYRFEGWSLDGTNIVDCFNIEVTEDVTYYAVFKLAYKWITLDRGIESIGFGVSRFNDGVWTGNKSPQSGYPLKDELKNTKFQDIRVTLGFSLCLEVETVRIDENGNVYDESKLDAENEVHPVLRDGKTFSINLKSYNSQFSGVIEETVLTIKFSYDKENLRFNFEVSDSNKSYSSMRGLGISQVEVLVEI